MTSAPGQTEMNKNSNWGPCDATLPVEGKTESISEEFKAAVFQLRNLGANIRPISESFVSWYVEETQAPRQSYQLKDVESHSERRFRRVSFKLKLSTHWAADLLIDIRWELESKRFVHCSDRAGKGRGTGVRNRGFLFFWRNSSFEGWCVCNIWKVCSNRPWRGSWCQGCVRASFLPDADGAFWGAPELQIDKTQFGVFTHVHVNKRMGLIVVV